MRRVIAVFLWAFSWPVAAQILVPFLPRDQPTQIAVTTDYDASTHLYKYSYTLTNAGSNSSPAEVLVVKLEPGVDVITSINDPEGWMHIYSEDRGTVYWGAVGYFDNDALADPSGNITASDYAIRPGGSLGGFSFKSFSPPGNGLVITQTFAPLPTAVSEDDFEPVETLSSLPEGNGYRHQTTVPIPDTDGDGNRRPTVDGFLVFGNLKDKDAFSGSVLVVIRFAVGGEAVQMDTFKAQLNDVNVTRQFAYDATYKGYVARFVPSMDVLVNGRNVLLTSVAGTVPGIIDKPTLDTDRVSFEFSP